MDSYSKGEKNKTSSEGDTYTATSWTEAIVNNCQTSWEPSRSRLGRSVITGAGVRDKNEMDVTLTTNGKQCKTVGKHAYLIVDLISVIKANFEIGSP